MIDAYSGAQNVAGAFGIPAVTRLSDTDIGTHISATAAHSSQRTVELSEDARVLSGSKSVYAMDTGGGKRHLDLDTYFSPQSGKNRELPLELDGVLLPSSNNVRALNDHISSIFLDFLESNGIAEAPEKITYDNYGQIVLPADYQYADELKSALEDNPAMDKELRTVNALSSHLAAMKELEPFTSELSQAKTDAERAAIVLRYSHLLGDNRTYPEVSLTFNDSGELTIKAGGKALL